MVTDSVERGTLDTEEVLTEKSEETMVNLCDKTSMKEGAIETTLEAAEALEVAAFKAN